MKKLLLSATACLTMAVSSNAQDIKPCGTYQAREIYLKNVPGYAAKLNAAEAVSAAEYQAYLQNLNSAKTSSVNANYTFTVPVVFHVLHLGENVGTGINVSDALLQSALDQVNRDYARQGSDTVNIDPLFEPLYKNSHMHFELAKKDPHGNCTNGIVRHYDSKTNWSQADLFNYQYSTMAPGNWNPSKYLNIYIVKNIIDDGGTNGIIVGYTHLPGTAPIDPSDAIVYRYDFLSGLNARSLSHEIGHWFGLSHTFGSTNNAGSECGNDDINDTPATTGFFSTCPKQASYTGSLPPAILNPTDSSDIIMVKLDTMRAMSSLNSLSAFLKTNRSTTTGTVATVTTYTNNISGVGVAGGYVDYSDGSYPNDFTSGSKILTVRTTASYSVNNYVRVYIDFNRDGVFANSESVLNTSTPVFGTNTFTTNVNLSGTGLIRMRVMTSDVPVTGPTMAINSGEIEDYLLNIGLASCDNQRPNIENIMDYSSCPKMFTQGQTAKMRASCVSMVALRQLLLDTLNLVNTGILNRTVGTFTVAPVPPSTVVTTYTAYVYSPSVGSPCAPIADFAATKYTACAGQSVTFNSTSYNSVPTSYSWTFEGGNPSSSTSQTQAVSYDTPGTYSVSLTVSNADGSSTKTVASYVKVNWNGAKTLPYSEDFEGQWWPEGMNFVNEDLGTLSWERSQYGAGGSAYSVVLPNANYVSNFPAFNANVDIMELPPFDFTNTSNISISYDYSFARKTGVVADTFKLQYSLDCGGTWINIPGATTASQMAASGGTVNAPYIPWSSVTPNPKWVTKSISSAILGGLNNKRDVKIRFWFQNDISTGQSQNLYIDNINISGTVGLNEFENALGLSIYPNPTSSSSVIEFTSPYNSKANLVVYDVTGRVVEENVMTVNSGVNTKYTVNSSNQLHSGVYFVSINIDGQKVIKKLIIE